MKKENNHKVEERLAELQQQFKCQLPAIIADIERIWKCLPRGEAQASGLVSLHGIVQHLFELSSVFGADAIAETAKLLSQRLHTFLQSASQLGRPASKYLDTQISRLALEAAHWQPCVLAPLPCREESKGKTVSRRVVLLVGCQESHVSQLSEAGYEVHSEAEVQSLMAACKQFSPAAIVIGHPAYAERPLDAIKVLAAVREETGYSTPAIVACNGTNMEAALAASSNGPVRFAGFPLDLGVVLHELEKLMVSQEDKAYRVLLVNEHELLLDYYGLVLQSGGMHVRMLNEPLKVLTAIEHFNPDVIVADAAMTACDFSEFHMAIHSHISYQTIPVIFLHAGIDSAQVHELVEDDPVLFLDKPLTPRYLLDEVVRQTRLHGKVCHLEKKIAAIVRVKDDFKAAMDQHAIVSITDVAGRICYVNEKFCEISGYSRDELLGKNHRILKSGLHDKTFYEQIWATITHGKTWHGEICNRRKNGGYYWVEASIMPLTGEDGRISQYISLRTDITRIKQDELAALETSNRLKSQQSLLVRLAAEPALNDQDPELFFKHLTRYTSENMGVGRVGLWDLKRSGQLLVSRVQYQARENEFSSGHVLALDQCPSFISELRSHKSIIVEDVNHDPAAQELLEYYLKPAKIGAFLDVPILHRGEMVGVLCIEYVGGERKWRQDELSFASALAALAAKRLAILERIEAEAVIGKQKCLLTLLNTAMTEFIANQELEQVAGHLLKGVLELTGSEYGFAGEVLHGLDGVPDFRLHALSQLDSDFSRGKRLPYPTGMRFQNLDTLFGEAMKKGEVVISNEPASDPRHRGLPAGHPPLTSYLGVPVYYGDTMVAMYSLANRSQGYEQELLDFLQPFNTTYGVLVEAARSKKRSQRVQQALLEAKEEADNANRAKSQFLSNMSHELRTPLNAIMGFGQLLQMDKEHTLSPAQRDSVEEILRASQHLLDLINEVLDLTRIEIGRIDLNMEPVVVSEFIDECLGLVAPQAQKRNIKVYLRGGDALRQGNEGGRGCTQVRADRTRLKQALLNLLSNAIKYNREGGEVEVSFSCTPEGDLHIAVRDTGPGIRQEQQAQLFQAFNRLGAEQTEIEGTGIGLVITKKIIELMGGEIGVESMEGEGSTFWFDIPCMLNKDK